MYKTVRRLLNTQGLDAVEERELSIGTDVGTLRGRLAMPEGATALVVLARTDQPAPRTLALAAYLRQRGFGTLAFELLTRVEQADPEARSLRRFDVRLLGQRLAGAVDVASELLPPSVRFGLFGTGTGAAAVLIAAASRAHLIQATVLRAGRPDLAVFALRGVQAPTLMIVGADDEPAIHWNEIAAARFRSPHHLHLVPGASRSFEEPGALDDAVHLTSSWFEAHLFQRGTETEPSSHGQIATSVAVSHTGAGVSDEVT